MNGVNDTLINRNIIMLRVQCICPWRNLTNTHVSVFLLLCVRERERERERETERETDRERHSKYKRYT